MASSCSCSTKRNFIVVFLFLLISNSQVNGRNFSSMFSFGDSMSDTGNLVQIRIIDSDKLPPAAFPPNGRTFFHHPAGRRCDGRLIIDFLAEAFGFPLLPPYFGVRDGPKESFQKGMNFAIQGATALDSGHLYDIGIPCGTTNFSLIDEMRFFKQMLPSFCLSSSDCQEFLKSSLIVMGEIGGNDYWHGLREGKSLEEIQQLVPLVIQSIASAINELIDLGAVTILAPGKIPLGCSPSMLTYYYQSSNEEDYDLTGCLKWANQLSVFHNEMLQEALEEIRNLHPIVSIIYGDFYNAAMRIYQSPKHFGFNEYLKACCGKGGVYNYNQEYTCGDPPVRSCCDDPSTYVNWDGVHFTEAGNRLITNALLEEFDNMLKLSSV